jgi:CubicO group peptidase (beta-lactamase class C family)|tara:strand:- start:25246 stop:27138 length:1893 start_codon:yes stop_codon:yes gene_type:complete
VGGIVACVPSFADETTSGLQPAAVATFVEAFFDEQMAALHVPGAVFVMVQHDSVVIELGYGYADVDTKRPVDSATTLFQVASVSKVFTATAVMQMIERGRLDLDVDVNEYLSAFQLESSFTEPVTLAHLLTHTAGFDELNVGYAARSAAAVRPLRSYLAERMPSRTIPPGTVTSYSNHGFGLLGLVLEEASGESFAGHMARNVLLPLGMQSSTFDLPLPDSLSAELARGYRFTGETYQPLPLLFRNVPPAGALSVTANDMSHFMIAHLNNGRYGGTQLLQEATVLEMHRQQFSHHPRLAGMAYGFIEQYVNGHRVLQHAGAVPGYRSLLLLLPGQNTGFFIAYNASSSALWEELLGGLMDQFLPPAGEIQPLDPAPETDLSPYTGYYRLTRYNRGTLEKLLSLFNSTVHIDSDSAGYLITRDGARWVEVEPLLFRQQRGEAYLAFKADGGGITHLFRTIATGGVFPGAYEKLAWYETPVFVNEFYLSWVLFLLITSLVWPMTAAVRLLWPRWRQEARCRETRSDSTARLLVMLFGMGSIWFAVGFIQKSFRMVERGGGELIYGMPRDMDLLLWIPVVQVGLLVILLGCTILAWRRHYWSLVGRLHFSALTLACLAWVVFAAQYNLIGHLY